MDIPKEIGRQEDGDVVVIRGCSCFVSVRRELGPGFFLSPLRLSAKEGAFIGFAGVFDPDGVTDSMVSLW